MAKVVQSTAEKLLQIKQLQEAKNDLIIEKQQMQRGVGDMLPKRVQEKLNLQLEEEVRDIEAQLTNFSSRIAALEKEIDIELSSLGVELTLVGEDYYAQEWMLRIKG